MFAEFFEPYVAIRKSLPSPYTCELLIDASTDVTQTAAVFQIRSLFGGGPVRLSQNIEQKAKNAYSSLDTTVEEVPVDILEQHFASIHATHSLRSLPRVAKTNGKALVQKASGHYQLVGPMERRPRPSSYSFHVHNGCYVVFCSPARQSLSEVHKAMIEVSLAPIPDGRAGHQIERTDVISSLVNCVSSSPQRVAVCYVCGPSGSGKTTNAEKLSAIIQQQYPHINTATLPLDAYQNHRKLFPVRPLDGEYDMESFKCLRPDAIQRDIQGLVLGNRITLPTFDFGSGEYTEGAGASMQVSSPSIVFVEGLHALHPAVRVATIPEESIYRLFILPVPKYKFSESAVGLGHRECRLLRRMHRDVKQKRNTPQGNLRAWPSVVDGENTWIFPHLPTSNHVFNNSMEDEVMWMRKDGLDNILSEAATKSTLAQRLWDIVRIVAPDINPTSSLRAKL
eukprot:PhF_6_TR30680/c0_g1_i1/m.45138/K00876/udk, UCK; uridine kinase